MSERELIDVEHRESTDEIAATLRAIADDLDGEELTVATDEDEVTVPGPESEAEFEIEVEAEDGDEHTEYELELELEWTTER